MWAARSLEEQSEYTSEMASDMAHSSTSIAREYRMLSRSAQQKAEVLRKLIVASPQISYVRWRRLKPEYCRSISERPVAQKVTQRATCVCIATVLQSTTRIVEFDLDLLENGYQTMKVVPSDSYAGNLTYRSTRTPFLHT